MSKKNWIQDAIGKPGALHKQMGIKEGQKIPYAALRSAAKGGNSLKAKRARLAMTLRKMKK